MITAATSKRVCVVGAGPSGIAAAKALHARGLEFECFERRARVGGLWAITDGEIQASYPSLECNTSKRRTQFSDFPMPRSFPPYPHNRQMAAYFDAYVDHFGFRDHIRFNTEVRRATRTPDGGWDIEVSSGRRPPFRCAGGGQRPSPRAPLAGPSLPRGVRRPAAPRP